MAIRLWEEFLTTSAVRRLYKTVLAELNECAEVAVTTSISFHGNAVWVSVSNCVIAFDELYNNVALSTGAAAGTRSAIARSRDRSFTDGHAPWSSNEGLPRETACQARSWVAPRLKGRGHKQEINEERRRE